MKKLFASMTLVVFLLSASAMAFAQTTILYTAAVSSTGFNTAGTIIATVNLLTANGAATTGSSTFTISGTNANGMLATCLSALAAGKTIQFRATSAANLTPMSSLVMTNNPAP